MRLSLCSCLTLTLLCAFGQPAARAQQIDSVSGLDGLPQGVIGTQLVIDGTGFGTGKPRVRLTDPRTGKKYRLKVLEHAPTQVVAEIRKAIAGELQLTVDPKGKAAPPIGAPGPVTVLAPDIHSLGVFDGIGLTAVVGKPETVSILGKHFGAKKRTVRLAGKKLKISHWSNTLVLAVVPEHAPSGLQLLELFNKVGTSRRDLLVLPEFDGPASVDPALVSVAFTADATTPDLQPSLALIGTTTSPLTGAVRTYLDVRAVSDNGYPDLRCMLLLDESLVAPFTLTAPFDDPASATVLLMVRHLYLPAGPADGAPASPKLFVPAEPFEVTVTALDPMLQTVELHYSGTMQLIEAHPTFPQVSGSISVAP